MTTEKLSDADLTYLELEAKSGDQPAETAKKVLQLVAEVREVRDDSAQLLAQDALAKVEDLEFDVEHLRAELNSLKTEVRLIALQKQET